MATPPPTPTTRLTAAAGPALFALYGITRDLDGLDNNRGDGALWDVGHLAFLLSTMAFAVLAVQLMKDVLGGQRRALTGVSTAALLLTLAGSILLCWVLLMDLRVPVGPVPDAVVLIGPVLLGVGLVVLLLTQVGRQLSLWSPLTFLVADASVGFNLDLATPAGLIMTAALWPLVRQARAPKESRSTGSRAWS